MLIPLLTVAALATAVPADSAGPTYHGRERQLDVTLPRLTAEIVIDGKLDEAVWSQAARLTGFSQYAPVDDQPASDSTEVAVWYSPTAIYFGIRAFAAPGSVRATLGDRDKTYNDDYIGIFLTTGIDRRQALVFASNPLGVQGDGIVVEGTGAGGDHFGTRQVGREPTNISPDYVFQSKGHVTEFGYEIEIRIPFKSIRFQSTAKQTWGLNVIRKVQSRGEEHSWVPARRAASSYLSQFGALRDLEGLSRGRVLDVTPVVTNRIAGTRNADGSWNYDRENAEFGGSVRYGLTNDLTLNGTVRPDFAEVESDAGQLVFDPRATLYFTEKRPFFLDASEQFAVPSNLIYSRSILEPRGAVKVTGSLGATSVGALVAQDARARSISREARPTFMWLRMQRPLGSSTALGMVYTGREDGDFSNRVLGTDARIVLGKSVSALLQGVVSRTTDSLGTRTGPLWRVNVDRNGRRFAAHYAFSSIHNDFSTASGYISRDSIVHANATHGLTFFAPKSSIFQTIQADIVTDGTWRYSSFARRGDAIEKKLHFNSSATLRGGWQAGASVLVESFGFDPDLYANYRVRHPLDPQGTTFEIVPFTGTARIPNLDYSVSLNTPNFKRFSLGTFYLWGRDENFFEWASSDITFLSLNADWRPTAKLRVGHTYTMQTYRRRTDGSLVARNQIPRLKVEYQLTRSIFVRAVGEYNVQKVDALRDDSRTNDPLVYEVSPGQFVPLDGFRGNSFRPEFLFSYAPSPGTVFYAGYSGAMNENRAYRFNGLRRERDGFFVKLSYLIRQ